LNWHRPMRGLMNKAKAGFLLFMIAMIIAANYPPADSADAHSPGKVYYVATDGDDGNPGTQEAPWRTIQKAADSLMGGETVWVREGVYEEFVTIKSSGSAAAGYITFQAFPGEKPVIDGSNLSISSGRSALVQIRGANYIVVEGFEIRGLSSASSSEYPAGIRVQDGGSNIHILNNEVHRIANSSPDGNAHGIHVYGNSKTPLSQIRVSGNQVHHLILGSSESLTISGNVDGFAVEGNVVHDNNNIGIDIAGFYGACSSPCVDQARNGTVADNIVYNISSASNPAYGTGSYSAGGIYADGASNVVIERNRVYASNFGIEIASENFGKSTSRITVRNNYIYSNDGAGIIMGGSGTDNGGASSNLIVNNTLYRNDVRNQGYGEITLQEHNVDNVIANNVLYGNARKPLIHKSSASGKGNRIDYNLYYHHGNSEGTAVWKWERKSYSTWEAYKIATGFDAHSQYGDPMLSGLERGDIRPSADSPLIDRGTDEYAAGDTDYYGSLRRAGASVDVGAAEWRDDPAPDSGEPTPVPQPTPAPTPDPSVPDPVPTEQPPKPTAIPEPTVTVQPPATGSQPLISVDGDFSDWSAIEALSRGSDGSKASTMKAVIADDQLYVLITGNLLTQKGQIYLDADNDRSTGFQAPFWKTSGADYLLENGTLYRYSGRGSDWNWTKVRSKQADRYVATSTVVETSIALSDLNAAADTIRLGYVWNDSRSDKLPAESELAIAAAGGGTTPEQPDSGGGSIRIDGLNDEWSRIDGLASAASNPRMLKAAHDEQYLYVLVEGADLTPKLQLYFNTDADSGTGYKASAWSSSGAEYLLENGRLYAYTGTGSNWSWKEQANLKKQQLYAAMANTAEAAIPLSALGVRKGDAIGLGVLLNDKRTDKLPAENGLAEYALP
jgi:Endopolygalacturonase